MTIYAIIVDKASGNVMQTWVGPEAKGYPESQNGMHVVPVTEAKSATIKGNRLPGWYCSDLNQLTEDPEYNDDLIVQHEDTRPIFRLAYSVDGTPWEYFKSGVPLIIDNERLKLKVICVNESKVDKEFTKDLRVNLGDKLVKLRIQAGESQDLRIDTGGNRSLVISSSREYRVCETHGPVTINIYTDDTI